MSEDESPPDDETAASGAATETIRSKPIRIQKSVLQRAIHDDPEALEAMFRNFIPPDEDLKTVSYLGTQGIWGLGTHSFACLTHRRGAGLTVGSFGKAVYRDGFLEESNSGAILQPSRLPLWIGLALGTIASLCLMSYVQSFYWFLRRRAELEFDIEFISYLILTAGLIIAPLTMPLFWTLCVRLYYRFFKCGMIIWIREGISIYWYVSRDLMSRASHLYRRVAELREIRIHSKPDRPRN